MSDVDCPVLTILHGGHVWLLALRQFLQLVPACAHVLKGHLAHGHYKMLGYTIWYLGYLGPIQFKDFSSRPKGEDCVWAGPF